MTKLTFQSTTFDIVDRNGAPWLKSQQIAEALGYADERSINRIYARNAGEFTEAMTTGVKLTTVTGEKETRIFSLRGAHLLAMFARTEVAKDFRVWVLDILDHHVEAQRPPKRPQRSIQQRVEKWLVKQAASQIKGTFGSQLMSLRKKEIKILEKERKRLEGEVQLSLLN